MYRNIYILTKIKLILDINAYQVNDMIKKNINIWVWIQNGRLLKAIFNFDEGTVRIFDENDRLILKRTGLNKIQVKQIETCVIKYGAKRLGKHAEPFKFLR